MNEDKFRYEYHAPSPEERNEAERIRARYAETDESDAMERLRKLDARVRRTASAAAWVMGVAGTLLFGAGLAMVLEGGLLAAGSAVACAGAVPVAAAYPVYGAVLRRGKKKYGAQILALSDEVLKEENKEENERGESGENK